MPKEYQTFVSTPEFLKDGGEMILAVKDLSPGKRKYDNRFVRAILHKDPKRFPGVDLLWLRTLTGRKLSLPWAIQIVEELGDSVKLTPYDNRGEMNRLLN
jgi:hypothetical protein